jgi:hypothetical protein
LNEHPEKALRDLVEGSEIRLEKRLREIQQQWDRHASGIQEAAETVAEKALTNREEALGPQHPSVATSLENYALCLRAIDRLKRPNNLNLVRRRFGEGNMIN